MPAKFQCEVISWDQIISMSRQLSLQIKQDRFIPDIIIAIGRGGYVPARLIADFLDILALTSLKVEHYIGSEKQARAKVIFPLSVDVSGKRVLIVDDVSDTGETFEAVKNHILNNSTPTEIRFAALHHKVVSHYLPEYFAQKVITWRWIIYPWAMVEDISRFINEVAPNIHSTEVINEKLETNYGIRVDREQLEFILEITRN